MYNNQFYGINALNTLSIDEILIYLRKSRQDDPNETVEEVLARHELILQSYSMRVWGAKIPEENIYREVVSGETIEDRPEIKKVIERVQDKKIKAVLVVEVSRLSRGDMLDLGTIEHAFLYTSTLCITPERSYDLENKHDRRAFEEELRSSGRFLEQTKELLVRGRRTSTMQGYWVCAHSPFGYDREQQKNKKYILVQNENAVHVRMIFEWYAEGVGLYEIAKRLTDMRISPKRNVYKKWSIPTLKNMLRNDAYIGIVRYGESKTIRVYENGKLKKKQVPAPESDVVVAKGLHIPIISFDLWERVQARIGNGDRTNSAYELSNPLAGLLICKKCGYMMRRKTSTRNRQPRYLCVMSPACETKSAYVDEVLYALQDALRVNVAEVEEKIESGAESQREAREAQLASLMEKLEKLQDQEDHQYDLLERKEYTPELFNRRHSKLVKEMDGVRAAIEEARTTMPDAVDYEDALVRLHAAIDALDNDDMMPIEKNIILKAIVDKVEYTREKEAANNFALDVYLKL